MISTNSSNITDTNLRISVIGLDRLGSSMVAVFAAKGYHVIGLDINNQLVDALQRGEVSVHEPQLQEMIDQYKTNIETTMDYYKAISETDMTMIAVPTLLNSNTGCFSNDKVLVAIKEIGNVIKTCNKYHQVIILSTVMPTSSGGNIRSVLESSSGRKVGCLDSEIGLAYNPVFTISGQIITNMLNPEFILIGESDKRIGDALKELYLKIVTKPSLSIHRMNLINAEITKLAINTYMTTSITYANMISELCENFSEADSDIVCAAINCNFPIENKYLKSALTYGRPWLTRDSDAFVTLAKSVNTNPLLVEATDQLNNYQVKRLVKICKQLTELRSDGTLYIKSKVGILGLPYISDTSIAERSTTCILANELINNYDVCVYEMLSMSFASHVYDQRVQLINSIDTLLYEEHIDILLIMAVSNHWDNIMFNRIEKKPLYIVDCWRLIDKEKIEKTYHHIRIISLGNGDSMIELKQRKNLDEKYERKLNEYSINICRQLRILVAGGAGFIGSHLARRLLKEGHYVICADWKKNEYFPEKEFCNKFLHMDLRTLHNCLIATKDCDWVFNLSADMGGMGFIQSNNSVILFNNTMISFNMIEAARQNGVQRFFYASSACVYPENIQAEENIEALREEQAWPAKPQDAYGLEKLVSEELAIHYAKDFQKMETRIGRFHNIYGPFGQWKGGKEKAPAAFCRKVLVAHEGENHGVVTVWGDGKQTRSFCYIDDCIDGIIRLMQSDYTLPLNIGSNEMVSVNDMIDIICQIEQISITLKHISGPEGVRGRNSDNTLIDKVLQWSPSITLSDGLKSTYKFIKNELELEKKNGMNISSDDNYPYPGLRHLRTNFKCQIAIAQLLNKTMVFPKSVGIPTFHSQSLLYPIQNKFITISTESIINVKLLSLYFDVVSYHDVALNQNNSVICSFQTLPLVEKHRYCCWQELCAYNPPQFPTKYSIKHVEDNFYRHQQPTYLQDLAHKLISKIKSAFYTAIHIRRGDKLREPRYKNKLDYCTRPSWIREKLNSYGISHGSIYIATNEYQPHFFDSLTQWYTIYTITNFSIFINETIKQNPYALIIIDEIIYSNAKVKVSTFIEPYTNRSFCPFGRAGIQH
ncbi:unnamed protein product [Adineta steineri]|uniref:UDP-glucose 6-dehydrogenase n=1 Tax=Adineta steineri TaxID=433720 RepID=A0A818X6H9_9BILA|nr:unnamed protein product [Adineta steineri]